MPPATPDNTRQLRARTIRPCHPPIALTKPAPSGSTISQQHLRGSPHGHKRQAAPPRPNPADDESLVHLTYSVEKAAGEEAVRNAIALGRASGELTADLAVSDVSDFSFYP